MPHIPKLTNMQAIGFRSILVVDGDCWGFTRNHSGTIRIGGITDKAYRFGLAITQDVPFNGLVRHLCNNPKCCNPAHLRLGTIVENNLDRKVMRHCRIMHGCKNNSHCGNCTKNPLLQPSC